MDINHPMTTITTTHIRNMQHFSNIVLNGYCSNSKLPR